jgi:hypothetical protein
MYLAAGRAVDLDRPRRFARLAWGPGQPHKLPAAAEEAQPILGPR